MSRMLAAIIAALLFSSSIQAIELYPSKTALGTVTSGVWNGDVVIGTYGGTGINNSTRTLTLNNSTTITTAAATVLDDTTVSAMVDTIGGASATGTGGLVRSVAPTLTAAYIIQNSGAPQLQVGRSVNNGILINGQGGAAHYNFSIAQQNNVDGGLEFTPSTTVGGSTFSTPAMVVLRTGNVGIGTNAPGAALHIGGTGTIRINGATSGTGTAAIIDSNGDIRPLTSSIKFKQNIVGLKFDTDLIGLLRPVEYDYKESGEHDFGLIAEEVADIYPLMVNYDNSKNPYSVKYQQLSVLLLKKIQEIELRLQELEAVGI